MEVPIDAPSAYARVGTPRVSHVWTPKLSHLPGVHSIRTSRDRQEQQPCPDLRSANFQTRRRDPWLRCAERPEGEWAARAFSRIMSSRESAIGLQHNHQFSLLSTWPLATLSRPWLKSVLCGPLGYLDVRRVNSDRESEPPTPCV